MSWNRYPAVRRQRAVRASSAVFLALLGCTHGESALSPLPPPPPAAPGKLVMITQPVGGVSGAALATQPVVEVRDLNGYPSTASIVVTASVNGGGRLDGPGSASVVTVNGRAAFSDLHVTGAGIFTMTFSSTAITPAISDRFVVTAAPAAALFAINAPTDGTSGEVLGQSVVSVRDAAGGQIADATNAVTASIASGPGVLSGTTTVSAVGGIASFRDLRITGTGVSVIRYSSGSLSPATSPSVRIVGPPVSVHFAEEGPQIIAVGESFFPSPVIRDADSTVILPALTRTSRDASIASVNSGGVVTGASGGTTVVLTSVASAPALADSQLVGVVPQTSAVLYATPGRFTVKTDTTLTFRIYISTKLKGGVFAGSGQVDVRFDPAQFGFVSVARGNIASATFDETQAAAGLVRIAFAETSNPPVTIEIARITVKAGSRAGTVGTLAMSASRLTAMDGADLLPALLRVNQPIVLR